MVRIDNHGPMITEADIQALESLAGSALPANYRNFLLMYNGGSPFPDGIMIPGFDEVDVQVFFGVNRPIQSSCISWNIKAIGSRLPRGGFPIACDSGGNIFCISLQGKDTGSILYLDLESVFGDAHILPPVYAVSPTFKALLHKLHD